MAMNAVQVASPPQMPDYVQGTEYDEAGRVTLRTLGDNAVQTRFTYSAWNYADMGGKLQRIFSQKPGENPTTHQDLRYTYDENGNIMQILDYVSADPQTEEPLTQDFEYDALDRLTYAIGHYGGRGNYPEEYYTYNSVTGNLSSKAGLAYTYGDPAHKHAVTAMDSNSYSYDANGNMITRMVNQQTYNFTYDAENHLIAVSGAAQEQFTYNGDGQRVVATEGITKTVFVGNYFEWQIVADGEFTTTQTTKYYYAGGTRVAMQRGGEGTKYLLGDHLGSASVVLNADGTALGSQGYLPWGKVNFTEGTIPTEYTFTGQYSDSCIKLLWYNSRWYDPELGRFMQPDIIIPEASQGTLAWDRYAYVNNNPLKWDDPSGHCLILCTAIIGAAIGAIVGAVGYTAYTAATGSAFNVGSMLLAAGGGAVAGAFIGSGVGLIAAASGAAAGAAGAATTAAEVAAGASGTAAAANTACGGDMCASEAQSASQTATAAAQALGKAGEAAANIVKNTVRIPSLTQTANYRIPDQLLPNLNILSEVKNVQYLGLTNQIEDFLMYAEQQGYVFQLFVRESTRLSGPLMALEEAGRIVVLRILPQAN
jgi:RHS repeat-associated protein